MYSAIGLLMSDVKHDYVQSRMTPMAELSPDEVNALFARLQAQAETATCAATALPADRIRVERALDLRYAGQGYEITLPCPTGAMTAASLADLRKNFDAQHRTMFGHSAPEEPVEVVSYRVRGLGPGAAGRAAALQARGHARLPTRSARPGACGSTAQSIECPVYQRETLDVGLDASQGPAVLDQFDCTTVLCPGQTARVDEWKNLIVTMEK